MRNHHKHLIAAGLLALGFAVTAQTTPAPAPATPQAQGEQAHGQRHGRHYDPAKMQERMAKRQAAMKQTLQITPAQEGAWTTFTAAMKPPANLQRMQRDEFAKLSTPERIDRRRAMRTARIAEMDKRGDATKTFYAALNADQKKVFDAETSKRHRGGHHGQHRKG